MAKLLIGFFCFTLLGRANARDLDKLYEKAQLQVGKHKITAYIADDDARRAQGLMFVESLPKDTGMLFIFEDERPLAFWMKNTLIPLAIGYFDAKGVLVDIQEMKPAPTLLTLDSDQKSYESAKPSVFALEMAEGWFAKNGIKVGAKLTLLSGGKSELLKSKLGRKTTSRQ